MIVTLKGKAKDAQSSVAGIYVRQPKPINGKPQWLQTSGSNAIWKKPGIWAIGSHGGDILSFDDVYSPQEATTWQYFDGKEFIASDDILVVAGMYNVDE